MNDDETPVEEPETSSRAAGGCVLAVVGGVPLAAVFAVSPDAGVLAVWGVGTVALWWAVRRVPHAANPAPPPPSEGADEKKPLFSVVDDPDNPNRSRVVWHAQKGA
jgi:predicted MFS family arabinose efflux permease